LKAGGKDDDKNVIRAAISTPTPDRLLKVAQVMRPGDRRAGPRKPARSIPGSSASCAARSSTWRARVKAHGLPDNAEWMRNLKANGFSDARLAP
jgi:carbamoyl-phosphate synthase large subunit